MNRVRLYLAMALFAAVVAAVVAVGMAAYFLKPFAGLEGPALPAQTPAPTVEENSGPSDKIIVSDQAQKNLGITAKQLQAGEFWKTITIQGMVVDRPGFSDREIASPVAATVMRMFNVPGDLVHPGDKLFTLKLASESLQQLQGELFKTNESIKQAQARRERLASGGEAIAQARVIEAENEIARLAAAAQSYRQELSNRGFSSEEIEGVASGRLLTEITLVAPPRAVPSPAASGINSTVDDHPAQVRRG